MLRDVLVPPWGTVPVRPQRVYFGAWGHVDDGRIVVRKLQQGLFRRDRQTQNIVFWAKNLAAALRWCHTSDARARRPRWIEMMGRSADRRRT